MFLLIRKPPGPTSHDIINTLRRLTSIKTIGHAGTLDPFAAGLLIIGLGRDSTRQLNSLLKLDKTYEAALQLGAVSDTYDKTGEIKAVNGKLPAVSNQIESILSEFIGPQLQLPPIYSAKKLHGQPLYRLARKGQTPDIKPHQINIYDIKLIGFNATTGIGDREAPPSDVLAKAFSAKIARPRLGENFGGNRVNFFARLDSPLASRAKLAARLAGKKFTSHFIQKNDRDNKSSRIQPHSRAPLPWLGEGLGVRLTISCSSGTYIRSLAHDIGQALGCGAYLAELTRASIGPFNLKQAVSLDQLTPDNWRQRLIKNLPRLPAKTKVLAFGTFDRLHPGHVNFLKQAKQLGDELYVVIARDHNVKIIKNRLHHDNEQTRLHNIKNLNLAADVMLGTLDLAHRYRILNKTKPDIIALGYDQPVNLTELKSKLKHYHLNTAIKRLKSYYPEKYKTSKIN